MIVIAPVDVPAEGFRALPRMEATFQLVASATVAVSAVVAPCCSDVLEVARDAEVRGWMFTTATASVLVPHVVVARAE
jgi:hypothetical protein